MERLNKKEEDRRGGRTVSRLMWATITESSYGYLLIHTEEILYLVQDIERVLWHCRLATTRGTKWVASMNTDIFTTFHSWNNIQLSLPWVTVTISMENLFRIYHWTLIVLRGKANNSKLCNVIFRFLYLFLILGCSGCAQVELLRGLDLKTVNSHWLDTDKGSYFLRCSQFGMPLHA